jgi:hypothetical protein
MLSITVAAACHDYEHPGVNNVYLVEARDPIAIRYNGNTLLIIKYFFNLDVSVLENYHIATSSAILQDSKFNIFEKYNREEYKRCRQLMISCVLGTDMSKHFTELGKLKTRTTAPDFSPHEKDKELVIVMMFHLTDISNSTKSWDLCAKWTELLFTEFFI